MFALVGKVKVSTDCHVFSSLLLGVFCNRRVSPLLSDRFVNQPVLLFSCLCTNIFTSLMFSAVSYLHVPPLGGERIPMQASLHDW